MLSQFKVIYRLEQLGRLKRFSSQINKTWKLCSCNMGNKHSVVVKPFDFFKDPYSALLLYQTDLDDVKDFEYIWNNATFRVAVDGGMNHWHNCKNDGMDLRDPTLVCGDFDSILPQVKIKTEAMSAVKIQHTPDQDHTDFTKALHILKDEEAAPKRMIAMVSNLAGRFDQHFANINTLIKSLQTDMQVFLYDHKNLMFAIPANTKVELHLRPKLICGIIPVMGPSNIKTQGLKWNLNDVYNFGGVISTSNETVAEVVTVESDQILIITVASSIKEFNRHTKLSAHAVVTDSERGIVQQTTDLAL